LTAAPELAVARSFEIRACSLRGQALLGWRDHRSPACVIALTYWA